MTETDILCQSCGRRLKNIYDPCDCKKISAEEMEDLGNKDFYAELKRKLAKEERIRTDI